MEISMPPFFWQEAIWQRFISGVNNGRMPHAILLTAAAGLGADELAMAMGQYLLCLSPMEMSVCNKCKSCKLLIANSHPDLLKIDLEEKATQIKIDQIRESSDFISKTSQQGGYKIVIISSADKMNKNAANALLKNLEEPAGKTLIVLVSNNPHYILPTIRSRCFKFVINSPRRQAAIEWLREKNITDAEKLLTEANGAPLTVLAWHKSNYIKDRQLFLASLREIAEGSSSPILEARRWLDLNCDMLLFWLLSWTESLIKECVDSKIDERSELTQVLPFIRDLNSNNLFRYRDRLCTKKAQFVRSANLNQSLFLEELSLDWHALVGSLNYR